MALCALLGSAALIGCCDEGEVEPVPVLYQAPPLELSIGPGEVVGLEAYLDSSGRWPAALIWAGLSVLEQQGDEVLVQLVAREIEPTWFPPPVATVGFGACAESDCSETFRWELRAATEDGAATLQVQPNLALDYLPEPCAGLIAPPADTVVVVELTSDPWSP